MGELEASEAICRQSTTFENHCKTFITQKRVFERQYAVFYSSRFNIAKDAIQDQIRKKWGSSANVKPMSEVSGNESVVIVGTTFKHMERQPSILKEISEEHNETHQVQGCANFTSDDDYLILEDNTQRVVMTGNIDPHSFVTGVILAVSGHTEESGKFFVEDICYPSVKLPPPVPEISEDSYVLLLSGLSVGRGDDLMALNILVDIVAGNVVCPSRQGVYSRIVRVIIAGDSLQWRNKSSSNTAILTRKTKIESTNSAELLDDILFRLAQSVDVDLMPGALDPANHLLPQQPLHPCVLPRSTACSTLHLATNPYSALIGGVRFLGTAGQNVVDIRSACRISDPLLLMRKTLDWGHICPTAPDSSHCYPYLDKDPFVIGRHPNVYFAGNCDGFATEYYDDRQQVLMTALPKFRDTAEGVLVNLRNLRAERLVIRS